MVEILLLASAWGFSPPPVGHEVSLGLGYSEYQQLRLWYTAKEAVIEAGWSLRGGAGDVFTVRAALSTAVGHRRYVGVLNPPWQSDFAGTASVRVGVNWRYVGLEAGLGGWLDPTTAGPVPSLAGWVGADGYAHLWFEVFPGHTIGDVETSAIGGGIGHNSEMARVELGIWSSNWWGYAIVEARGEGRVREGLWVGARGRYLHTRNDFSRHESRVVLTVRFDPVRAVQAIRGKAPPETGA